MKRIPFLITNLIIAYAFLSSCSEQKVAYNFDIITKQDAVAYEKEIGSTQYQGQAPALPKGFCAEVAHFDLTESFQFSRDASGNFLPLTVKYYFEKGNDTIRFILYEWNKAIPGTTSKQRDEIYANEASLFEDYIEAYNSIWEKYHQKLGPKNSGTGKVVALDPNTYPRWKAELGWKTANKNIDLNFIWIPTGGTNVYKIYSKIYHDSRYTKSNTSISKD